jgi:nucleotide-binding universal stress UspA family protein
MQPIRRILVAVKNSQGNASPAVIKAAQLAQALGASVELFHAIVTPLYVDAYSLPNGGLADTERDIQQRSGSAACRGKAHAAARY